MGKILILSFEDDEEKIMNSILSLLENLREVKSLDIMEHQNRLHYLDITILFDRREVIKNNRKINLSYTEFEILKLLVQNPGRVFSKEQIYNVVWKEAYFGDYNIVMSHIHNIRKKIEDNPSKPIYIQTVWGVGYRFNNNLSNSL